MISAIHFEEYLKFHEKFDQWKKSKDKNGFWFKDIFIDYEALNDILGKPKKKCKPSIFNNIKKRKAAEKPSIVELSDTNDDTNDETEFENDTEFQMTVYDSFDQALDNIPFTYQDMYDIKREKYDIKYKEAVSQIGFKHDLVLNREETKRIKLTTLKEILIGETPIEFKKKAFEIFIKIVNEK